MTPTMTGYAPLDFGLLGVALIVIYKLADLLKSLYLSRKGNDNGAVTLRLDAMTAQRIKEIHQHAERMSQSVDRGMFACAWTGRDEVRDLMENLRELSNEVRLLRNELQKARNGHEK